ncbi:hypothetical protein [Saccharothrix luteola]|uniref:hypothetical protein n=1 Tax=Saccharothrix luteola TaxID=2893018 RepID=UPI001E355F0F|nr:hypothetical protein [Saccharothrix luteola]MCC8250342.1 hypothetical protein [Saccharothrix luteola]
MIDGEVAVVRKSPQEKKRLSYAKDRRNTYGENDKSSRRNIPLSKRLAHRADRHHADQALRAVLGRADEASADHAEQVARDRRPAWFRKHPDAPLGEVVADRLRERVQAGMDQQERAEARLARVRRHYRRTTP